MAAVTLNHNFNFSGMSDLTKSLEIFTSKLESISQSFSNPQYSQSTGNTNNSSTDNNQSEFTKTFETHGKKVEELTSSFNTYAETDKIKLQLNKDLNKNIHDLNKNMTSSAKEGGSGQSSFMKGIIGAGVAIGAAALLNKFSQQETIVGTAQQSINTGIMGSTGFLQDYQARMMQNQSDIRNIAATGIGAAIGGAFGGKYGAVIGGATANALYAPFNNKMTQQQIANMEFMSNRDQEAWQVRNALGAGTTSQFMGRNLQFEANGKPYASTMSTLQADMFTDPKLAPYANYANTYQLSENRQQYRSEGTNVGQNVKNMVNAGMAMGVSEQNMGGFINVATTAAQATGKETNKILNQTLEFHKNYGMEPIKNLTQAMQLMQTSHVAGTFDQAQEIAARYQYNPSALQNKINAGNVTPLNAWTSAIIGRIAGISEEEIHTGIPSAARVAKNASEIKRLREKGAMPSDISADFLTTAWAQGNGVDMNINNQFGILDKINTKGQRTEGQVENMTPSANMSAMGDFIAQSLQNLKIDTQTVNTMHVSNMTMDGATKTNTPSSPSPRNNQAHASKLAGTAGNGTTANQQPTWEWHAPLRNTW